MVGVSEIVRQTVAPLTPDRPPPLSCRVGPPFHWAIMGSFLDKPITEKETIDGAAHGLTWGEHSGLRC